MEIVEAYQQFKTKQVSISDVARRTGISRTTIYQIVGGDYDRTAFGRIKKVLDAMGFDVKLVVAPKIDYKTVSSPIPAPNDRK